MKDIDIVLPKNGDLDSLIHDINEMHKKFIMLIKKSALLAYQIGSLLTDIKQNRDQSIPWGEFFKAHFTFSERLSYTYMRMYEVFKGREKELKDLSITDGYVLGGIKKILPHESLAEKEGDDVAVVTEVDYDIDFIFSQKPVSKCSLKNYRIEPMGDKKRLWVIDRSGKSMPVVQLYTTEPAGLPESEKQELLRNVQIALETFYARIEEYEEKGIF